MPCKEEQSAELSAGEIRIGRRERVKVSGCRPVVINIAGKYSNIVSFAIVCFTTRKEATNADPRSKGAPARCGRATQTARLGATQCEAGLHRFLCRLSLLRY